MYALASCGLRGFCVAGAALGTLQAILWSPWLLRGRRSTWCKVSDARPFAWQAQHLCSARGRMYALAGFCMTGAALGALQGVGCAPWRPTISVSLLVVGWWQLEGGGGRRRRRRRSGNKNPTRRCQCGERTYAVCHMNLARATLVCLWFSICLNDTPQMIYTYLYIRYTQKTNLSSNLWYLQWFMHIFGYQINALCNDNQQQNNKPKQLKQP